MGKFLFILAILFATTVSFADGLCAQFCVDCSRNPAGESCIKIDQVCGNCPAILDSIRQDSLSAIARADSIKREKEIHDSLQKEDVSKLTTLLFNNCKSDTCNFEVTVNNGLLKHVRGKKGNNVVETDSAMESLAGSQLLPPMNNECQGFCGMCSADTQKTQVDSMCVKIETQCRCKAYAEQERQLAAKEKADSAAAVEKALARETTSQKVSNGIFEYCSKKPEISLCSLSVNLMGQKFSTVKIRDLSSGKEIAVVVDTVKLVVVEEPKVDTLADTAMVAVTEPPVDSTKIDSSIVPKPAEETIPAKEKSSYIGVFVGFEHYYEHEVSGYRVEDDFQWGVSLGFLWRWYLYRWGAFQMGLNFVYHHAEHELDFGYSSVDGNMDYQSIMLEVPLQIRAGFPLGKTPLSPFVSFSVYVRKPIYAWLDYDVTRTSQSYAYTSYTDYYFSASEEGFYEIEDWEFLGYGGLGLEINRVVSLQWQFLLFSTVTYSDYRYYANYFNNTNADEITWRIILDVAW